MSAPSDSRWSAFSVSPPSLRRSSVSATVSTRNASSRRARKPAGLWSPDHLAQDPRAAPNELGARHRPAAGRPDLGKLQKALAGYDGRGVTHRAEATGVTTGVAAGLVGTARDQGPCREDRDSA